VKSGKPDITIGDKRKLYVKLQGKQLNEEKGAKPKMSL
jgi:hypothetical protein